MSLFHFEIGDSSLAGQFPGNFGGGGASQHWRTHFYSNHPNMKCIQWMISSQVKTWSW
jgi:hypothetical protein